MKAEEWKSVEERLRVKQRERGGRVRGRKRERKGEQESMRQGRREAGGQGHPHLLAAPWRRRGPVRCGRTKSYPLMSGGASHKEGLTSAEPAGAERRH